MPVYDCGVPDCSECQREFGPDRSKAIADYQAKLRTRHDGRIPDRETFWLVERKVSPPQYVGTGAGWTIDPWLAQRFDTERQAHDHWRTMPIFRDESAVIEHLFINRQ